MGDSMEASQAAAPDAVEVLESQQTTTMSPGAAVSNVSSGSHSDASNLSSTEVLNSILSKIKESSEERLLVYDHISRSAAEIVQDHLESQNSRTGYNSLLGTLTILVMSSAIHNAHVPWFFRALARMLQSDLLSDDEFESFELDFGTLFDAFAGQYASSRKEPDLCIWPGGRQLPSLVVEAGWSESRAQLHRDKDLWVNGGAGNVTLVMLIKWTRRSTNTVEGDLELFDRDPITGHARTLQKEVIFPPPPPTAQTQRVAITRRQLFGANPGGGYEPDAVGYLNLDDLRNIAAGRLHRMGLAPAT